MRGLLLLLFAGMVAGVAWTAGFVYARNRFNEATQPLFDTLRDQLTDAAELDAHSGDLEISLSNAIDLVASTKKESHQ